MVIGVNSDITEAKQSAENTRLLLRELNHRVKNTLAMIQSLARQTLRRASDPSQFIESFGGRLRAVSDAHTLLSDKDWTGVRLWDLVQKQVAPYAQARPDQLVASGPDIDLPADHALGLALVLHELATNAARVGALSIPEGQVNIAWEVRSVGETRLLMRWKETGGPEVSPPEVTGFGSILIARSLDKVLTSEVNLVYPRDGVEATISIPLPGPERP
jgi:two-component sensor histidine kinase